MHTSSSPATARLLVVCTLLLGLFLMHGAPLAAGGCHDDMARAVAAPAMASPHLAHPATADDAAGRGPRAAPAAADTRGGSACLSTPAHGRVVLDPPPLLAVLSVALIVGTGMLATTAGTARLRGPPGSGRRLLLQVCVART
ncbi:hypothetical protein ACGFX4_16410 [Kitasatospora sp. NPDC048365]|uniref:hypothetical protein n=1 Tax=Kitasatospora sp. NPDC048365 TaxID=3364050 RepID=UPI0037150520